MSSSYCLLCDFLKIIKIKECISGFYGVAIDLTKVTRLREGEISWGIRGKGRKERQWDGGEKIEEGSL